MASQRGKKSFVDDDESYWSATQFKGGFDFSDEVDVTDWDKKVFSPKTVKEDTDIPVINWDESRPAVPSARYKVPTKPAPVLQKSGHNRSASDTTRVPASQSLPSVRDPPRPRAPAADEPVTYWNIEKPLKVAKEDRFTKIPPEDMVRRMILGYSYTLEQYKSLEEKLAFLDAAVRLGDGDTITAGVLFLRATVKKSIFNREVVSRPVAVDHFLQYLKQHNDFGDLADMLSMLGRTEEAAMLKYRQAVLVNNPQTKTKAIQNCHRTHLQNEYSLQPESGLVQEHISLLEIQLPIEDADARGEKDGSIPIFKEYPRVCSIINRPLINTLFYCCFYHYGLGENSLASTVAMKKRHNIGDKQYLWCALRARAKLKCWTDFEALLTTKGWFGASKMKSPIGFDKIVEILSKVTCPKDILVKYLRLVDDEEKRLGLATKLKCHEIVVDTFVSMKDRARLESYKAKVLELHTTEYFYADDNLRNPNIKWKN
ncbi:spermatogenesis-defective protein 39 homolog [Lineus longissimus]|uniref:spermatogenesis-defective protein 39 homolog n=1 Tax=Lineus longissimus TaxID=88925 RepID=UPI002B4DCE61